MDGEHLQHARSSFAETLRSLMGTGAALPRKVPPIPERRVKPERKVEERLAAIADELREAALRVPGSVILDPITCTTTIQPTSPPPSTRHISKQYTAPVHQQPSLTPAPASPSKTRPFTLRPLNSVPRKRCEDTERMWEEREKEYEERARAREQRALARLIHRSSALAQSPLPSSVSSPPALSTVPSTSPSSTWKEDTDPPCDESPPCASSPSLLNATTEDVDGRETVVEEEECARRLITAQEGLEVERLLALEQEEHLKAQEETAKGERTRWEAVREAVWEEECLRKFVMQDSAAEFDELTRAIRGWLESLGSGISTVAVETAQREDREYIEGEEVGERGDVERAMLENEEGTERRGIDIQQGDVWSDLLVAAAQSEARVQLSDSERGSRVMVLRSEPVERAIIASQYSTELLALVDRLAWVTNCLEVEERLVVEKDEERVWKDITFDHPTSLSVVRWTLQKLTERNMSERADLAGCAERVLASVVMEEEEEREAVYRMRSDARVDMQRETAMMKRKAIEEAIALSQKFEEQTIALCVEPPTRPKKKAATIPRRRTAAPGRLRR